MDDGPNDEDDGPEDDTLVGHLVFVDDVVLEVVVGSFVLDLALVVLDPQIVVGGSTDVAQASRCCCLKICWSSHFSYFDDRYGTLPLLMFCSKLIFI